VHILYAEGGFMARYKDTPCISYVCEGECKKGRKEAAHDGYCQKCNLYCPRTKKEKTNKRKSKTVIYEEEDL